MIAQHFKTSTIACLLLLAACTEKQELHSELRIHFPKVNLQLDPHKMEDAYSMMIVSQLYRGLLRFNSSGDVVPDLASSWTESADRKTYRFKLRQATFSNGERITAKHVQLSFARIFILGSAMAADLDYIKGIKVFLKSRNPHDFGVKALSNDEVEFQLAYPSSLFLKHIAVGDCAIMPFADIKDVEKAPIAFSGPFKIEQQTVSSIDLVKWRGDSLESKNPPKKVLFFATDESAATLAKERKTDSLDRDPITSELRQELESKGWGISPTELTGETFIVLNPKYLSEELRHYLYLKVDPAAVVGIFNEPQFKPAYGLIPNGFPGVLAKIEIASIRTVNPQYHGKHASFLLDYDPSSDFESRIATYLKNIWSSDLVEVQLNPLTKSKKLQRMFKKQSKASLGGKGIDYPDGFSVLTYFKGKYEANYFHVNDPAIDNAISDAVKEFDEDKRTSLYKKIQLQVLKKNTLIPVLFGSQASGLWSARVKSVPSHPMGYHTMQFETIEMRAE